VSRELTYACELRCKHLLHKRAFGRRCLSLEQNSALGAGQQGRSDKEGGTCEHAGRPIIVELRAIQEVGF